MKHDFPAHTASEHSSSNEIKLNLKERKLISALSFNARLSPTELGKTIGISKDSVRYNLKKLKNLGIIPKSIMIVNPYAFGLKFNSIFLRLKNLDSKKEQTLIKFIVEHPFTIWCGLIGGEWDIGIHVLSKDTKHFDEIFKDIKEKCGDALIDSISLNVYGFEKYENLISDFRNRSGITKDMLNKTQIQKYLKEPPARDSDTLVRINKLEAKILYELAENPEISIANLSDKLEVSFDTIKRRIIRLVEDKAILAFHPLINLTSIGLISQTILIEAKSNIGNEKIEEYVKKDPNIGYALRSHGDWDWQLYTATHTPHEFYAMLRKIRSDLADHIKSSSVFMLIQDFKFDFTPSGVKKILKNLS